MWTAILSVTLLALAAGYYLGGRWSRREGWERLFVRIPATTAIVLCATAWLYPHLLPGVAYQDALAGAFLGSVLLLGPALVLLSAMGPIAIALTARPEGDRGAGAVFAVSTVGSVTGAPLGAFALLPFMAPAATLLVLAAGLVLVSGAALSVVRDRMTVTGLIPASAAAIAGAALVVLEAPPVVDLGQISARHVETARGPHGAIVVVDVTQTGGAEDESVRLYLAENQIQSGRATGLPGEPLRYVAIVNALLDAVVPADGRILVLGLAGGTIATDMAATGRTVQAAEIDPTAVGVAERHFGFDAAVTPVAVADARRVLTHCTEPYDAILFDTFSGLSVPDHLVTVEAFAAAAGCLTPDGALVVNAIIPPRDTHPSQRLIAAVAQGMGTEVAVYRDPANQGQVGNRILLADRSAGPPPVLTIADYPVTLFRRAPLALPPLLVDREGLAGVSPLSDHANDFALRMAGETLRMSHFPIPPAWQ